MMNLLVSVSLLLTTFGKRTHAAYCGCDSCTQGIWSSYATDSAGTYTCGGRINWLQTSLGYDEASACAKVSDEFPSGPCGPMCDPRVCNPPTFEPSEAPSRQEITYCGCDSCGQSVWDSPATDTDGTYTCGDRVTWLQTVKGYDEASACAKVASEFTDGPCGVCDPNLCGVIQSPTSAPSDPHSEFPSALPSSSPSFTPTLTPSQDPTLPPTPLPTSQPSPKPTSSVHCSCDSCTQQVWDSLATDAGGTYSCGARINWLQDTQGMSEFDACERVSNEFSQGPCGPACNPSLCGLSASPPPTSLPTKSPSFNSPSPSNGQKCGGAVDFTNDANQACQTYLWGPTQDSTMHCFSYGGSNDPCHLNNNNDANDGIFKDPSLCVGDTLYLWDEPDTQGRDYTWAGQAWYQYSLRFAQELSQMKSHGTKVTSPLLKAGGSGVIQSNMRAFFDACGPSCSDPMDPAYIDVIAINAFCGPWNGEAGCRGGARYIYNEAVSTSAAFNDRPVYLTNWSRLQTNSPEEQVEAIDCIDEFFPTAESVVKRVYWFGARDYGGGAETTGYLTNSLSDGRTLGQVWRSKCDSL